jgi:hypothetical protein
MFASPKRPDIYHCPACRYNAPKTRIVALHVIARVERDREREAQRFLPPIPNRSTERQKMLDISRVD